MLGHVAIYGKDEVERTVLAGAVRSRILASIECFDGWSELLDFIDEHTLTSGWTDILCAVVIHSARSNAECQRTEALVEQVRIASRRLPVLLIDVTDTLGCNDVADAFLTGLVKPAEALDAVLRLISPATLAATA